MNLSPEDKKTVKFLIKALLFLGAIYLIKYLSYGHL